jgi:hypothetical protein
MAWTQTDLDTIRSHVASGTRRVTYSDGRTIEYQSLDQLIAAERVIAAAIEMAARSASGIVRRRFGVVRSGT